MKCDNIKFEPKILDKCVLYELDKHRVVYNYTCVVQNLYRVVQNDICVGKCLKACSVGKVLQYTQTPA